MIEIQSIIEVLNYLDGLSGVIFDLDDTLYSEKEYVRSGYRKIAEFLLHIENVENKLWKLFEERKPAIDVLLMKEQIYTPELKKECLEIYRNQIPDIHFYDGVKELFNYLKKHKYKIGIITDGRPEGQRAKIQALSLEELVNEIIITDELGGENCRKPNAISFQVMSNRLKIDLARLCYVGDNITKDFIAPEKLGMKCIWFRNSDGLYYKN